MEVPSLLRLSLKGGVIGPGARGLSFWFSFVALRGPSCPFVELSFLPLTHPFRAFSKGGVIGPDAPETILLVFLRAPSWICFCLFVDIFFPSWPFVD